MLSFIPLFAVVLAGLSAVFFGKHRKKIGYEVPGIFLYLTFVLPFAAGGFHTYVSAVTTVCLMVHLLDTAKKQGYIRLTLNGNSIAVMLVVLGYCITPLWAADKGMAVFGIARFIPVALCLLVFMQMEPRQKEECLSLIPVSGACMTVLSGLLLLIPGTDPYLTVQGRLAGFLQYPNTYAAFLLAGLVLQYAKPARKKADILLDGILILGVILSGSKTGFVLLLVTITGIAFLQKKRKLVMSLAVIIVGGLIFALILSNLEILRHVNRFTDIKITSGSFLVRLLYFKDALPMILKNPFGYGYMGYRALEGTFQTGRYFVTYVHNGLLQMLFEIGWLPSLLMAIAFLRAMLGTTVSSEKKLLLFVVLAHCMLDFDLQFFIFWVILLACLDFETGQYVKLKKGKKPALVLCVICTAVCVWLGCGDLLYSCGKMDAALCVTPFHTEAMSAQLQRISEIDELEENADRILSYNPTHSLAYSAKGNAALSRGDIVAMITYKEKAIACSRYTAEEYVDYFEKLHAVMGVYARMGDTDSAQYCKEKLMAIPALVDAVNERTDPMAHRIGEDMFLKLPYRYEIYIKLLR